MRRPVRLLLLALLGLLAAAAPAPRLEAAPAAPAPAPLERTIDVDGAQRAYLIHVPAAWDRRAPIALLFVFHGAGADAESMVRATGFEAWAETEPTLIVYPRARRATKRFDVDGTRAQPSADVRFVDVLLERLRERFPLDMQRIYATGFSNGGAFCYRLAADRPSWFAAIAPVGGYVPASLTEGPDWPIPTLHVHGTADRRVPAPALPLAPTDRFATWLAWNGCGGEPTTAPLAGVEPLRATRVTWPCTGLGAVSLLLFAGQDHVWAGGPGGATSREIWTFLRSHTGPPPPRAGSGIHSRPPQ